MKPFLLLCLLLVAIGCGSTKQLSMKSNPYNGTWIPVQQELGGTSLPAAAFANQRLVINDNNYTLTAESVDKGVLEYKGEHMDIYSKEGVNAGKHFTALFKFENDLLSICYNLAGDAYPSVFDTKGKPLYFLAVFKKEQAK